MNERDIYLIIYLFEVEISQVYRIKLFFLIRLFHKRKLLKKFYFENLSYYNNLA